MVAISVQEAPKIAEYAKLRYVRGLSLVFVGDSSLQITLVSMVFISTNL